jgi:hypothetical protein
MLLKDSLDGFLGLFAEPSIAKHQLLCLGRDLRPPSGPAADLPLQQGKTKPSFQNPDKLPAFAIGHFHPVGGFVKGTRFRNSLEEFIRPIPEGLSVLIEPEFADNLHSFGPPMPKAGGKGFSLRYSHSRITQS